MPATTSHREFWAQKKVLVTGASSGIGHALALGLVRRGAHVLATARRGDRLESLANQASDLCLDKSAPCLRWYACDLTVASDRAALVNWVQTQTPVLDGLINNAGAGAIGPFEQASEDRLRKIMEIDFFAPVELTRALLPSLRSAKLSFVMNVGSVLGHVAVPNKSEYCAAKFAMRGWHESLRCELRGSSVRMLMASPSTTRSEFFDSLVDTPQGLQSRSLGSMSTEEVAEQILRSIPRHRRDSILSLGGKLLVWAHRLAPSWLERFL